MTARIFDRPDLDQQLGQKALYVAGLFPSAEPSAAYEGRLQIKNGIGACQVRQIDGDKLPEGYRLYVDQATQVVVLAWPAYVSGLAPIVNPGFEAGDSGWIGGPGWKISTENPPTGLWAAGYYGNWGESRISSTARYSVQPGQVTHAKCQVRQGASSEGNAGASVMLEYRNLAGEVIDSAEGNRVMSASKNRVYDSNVTGVAPAGAATINVAGNGIRHRQNKILFVDTFEWDHTVPSAGINYEKLLSLSLLVSDSRGRSYLWKGTVSVVLWDGAWQARTRGSMEWRGVPYAIKFNGAGRLLMGGHDGNIWWSDDKGITWTRIVQPPDPGTPYYTRAFAYNDRDQVLVACGHYVARSLDGGLTWGRSYTPYDSAWQFVKWIPEWNIFIAVGAGAYTRRILTLNAGGAAPVNKSNTGNYYNVAYSAKFDRAVCLPHAATGGSVGYAVCTADPTATAWAYYTPPSGVNINSRHGVASLPNGEIWVSGTDSTTSISGYVISRDGGLTFERPIRPTDLPGIPAGYNQPGFVAYDETLRLLVIQPYMSGPGVVSARQFISRDNGATFQATDIPAPLAGTLMPTPEGIVWSPSAGCFIGSDSDSSPIIYFSRTGLFK
ncbi:hypothetical protein AN993_21350 [Stenotrophomonas maltophilia]|nr:hypothetical protein AN993_21350 [Stenotrophomonas maltophilia]MBA0242697.1 exo-alpha-sialidase [Stenotrophomonas maltophilia]MBA0247275.1 exo-alpha-sialidase [Stenotrophomonas maltophilia]MBA0306242.1 exo-alpha-sialidase [Stenotrophomonas maltophilia]MBA0438855.1 exo-alpha-sialidase [Stenotrophomonas maltophilia]